MLTTTLEQGEERGESVQPNETVLRMCDLRRILFVAHIPVNQSERLHANDKVSLRVGQEQIHVVGKVLFVSPVVDSSSGRREVKNRDGQS